MRIKAKKPGLYKQFWNTAEAIADSPNSAFWSIIAISAFIRWLVNKWGDEEVWKQMPFDLWASIQIWLVLGLLGTLVLAGLAGLLTPKHIGRSLVIALIAWRFIRFLFSCIACLYLLWILITLISLWYHSFIADFPRSLFNIIGLTRGFLPPLLFALVVMTAYPVASEVTRTLAAVIYASKYFRWQKRSLLQASDPYAPTPIKQSTIRVLDELLLENSASNTILNKTDSPRVLLLSDLHGTSSEALTLEGNRTDSGMRDFVRAAIAHIKPCLIIAAGDMTDTGQVDAWNRLKELFTSDCNIVICPGNHDVNFRSIGPLRSTLQYMKDCFDLEGPSSGSYLETEVYHRIETLECTAGLAVRRVGEIYPITYSDIKTGVTVVVLNSNRRVSSSPATNALGYVGETQLQHASMLIEARSTEERLLPILIVLHHHIYSAAETEMADFFLVCFDAPMVLEFAFRHKAVAIVHGHKHMPYIRKVAHLDHALLVISVGSAFYDAKGPCRNIVIGPSVAELKIGKNQIENVVFYNDKHLTTS